MMGNKLLVFVLDHVLKLKFLDGYRMYASGAISIFTGLIMLLTMFSSGDATNLDQAITFIVAGLGVLGLAGKQDKQIAAAAKAVDD